MRTFHRAIIFTKVPLSGFYRFEDLFQILPAKLEGIPYSKFQRHFPVLLEYWTSDEETLTVPEAYEELKELYILGAKTLAKQDVILSLLTVFTNHHFFRYKDNIGGFWGVPILSDDSSREEMNEWSSKWNFPVFHAPELGHQLKIDSFSNTDDLDEVEKIDVGQYYMNDPNLDDRWDENLTLPASIDDLFYKYSLLDNNQKFALDAAVTYACSAIELFNTRKTLSLLSSFTAVETMVNIDFEGQETEKCPTCNQMRYSVSKKFREYLLKYIGDSKQNKKKFNTFYNFRSKIVHEGRLLSAEKLFSDVSENDSRSEYIKRVEILQLGRLSICAWLLRSTR